VLRFEGVRTTVHDMADEPQPWTFLIDSRISARKTQAEIAEEVGIGFKYYNDIESGHRRCVKNLQLLGRIANAVGVTILALDRSRPSGRGYRKLTKSPPSELAS
jgi:transcriptional regulator with XRE-family HTH domain